MPGVLLHAFAHLACSFDMYSTVMLFAMSGQEFKALPTRLKPLCLCLHCGQAPLEEMT